MSTSTYHFWRGLMTWAELYTHIRPRHMRANNALQPANAPPITSISIVNTAITWKRIAGLLCFVLSLHEVNQRVMTMHAHEKIPFLTIKIHCHNARRKCSKVLWFYGSMSRFVLCHSTHGRVLSIVGAFLAL